MARSVVEVYRFRHWRDFFWYRASMCSLNISRQGAVHAEHTWY
ncbi:MAG: hypothetical protein KatS3mg110_1397 [Pirellulaceae bacterium]|nr:MAG: hypothetical protein KatS3mg110_1397 [Pirellulaceae bacterium]